MPSRAFFRRIGGHFYSIYLHHAFFTAGARILAQYLRLPDLVLFLAALVAGISRPDATGSPGLAESDHEGGAGEEGVREWSYL